MFTSPHKISSFFLILPPRITSQLNLLPSKECNCISIKVTVTDTVAQFQKISLLPHRKDWNFQEGLGFSKTKTLKSMYQAYNFNFHRGEGGLKNNPFRAGLMNAFLNYTLYCCVKF